MKLLRNLALAVCGLTVALAGLAPSVSAASRDGGGSPDCGPIVSGLWQGINSALGTNYSCASGTTEQQNGGTTDENAGTTGEYMALGDSVAAGLGLPVAAGSDPACGVSGQAYPARVAASLNMHYQNLACSGATAGDLVTEQHLSGTSRDIEPQLDRAYAGGTPQLITITAGANDMYWQYFARKCYISTCGTGTDQAFVDSFRSILSLKLAYALQSIYNRSNGQPPRVILTGYYQPLSAACSVQQPAISAAEAQWLNGQLAALNQTISDVTSGYSFARYAAVDFSGHELCTRRPWVQGMNSSAPLHPTAAGQRAIAQAVLQEAK
jgi:lysophospholipase L1-like esterase